MANTPTPATARQKHAPSSKEPLQRLITRSPQLPQKMAKDTGVALTRGQKGGNPPAREDHAPITGERLGQRRRRMDQRTAANKAGGRVSTIKRRIYVDLAPKNVEKLNHYQIFPPATQTADSPPLEPLLSDFLPNKRVETPRRVKTTCRSLVVVDSMLMAQEKKRKVNCYFASWALDNYQIAALVLIIFT
jgi:hypothetical protein